MATATINGMSTFGSSGSGADSGWSNIGGGPGAGQNTDDFIEGTDAFGGRKTVTGRGIEYTLPSGTVDMSTTETHLYLWILIKSIGNLDLIANGGIEIRVGSSASNYRTFYIGGSDTVRPGWQCYVIDPTKTGSVADTGTPVLTAVSYVGYNFSWATTPGGTSDNVVVDIIRYSTGPYVTGGTSGDRLLWEDIAVADEASAYGIFNRQKGGFFVNGQLALGAPSGAGDCYLDDEATDIVWSAQEYEDGTSLVSSLAADFNALVIQEGTGTTDIEDGTLIGTGDDRSGISGSKFKRDPAAIDGGVSSNTLRLSIEGTITAVDMHGTTFEGFDTSVTLSNDATDGPNHVFAGCTFTGCEQVVANRPVIRNCVFSGYTGTDAALLWNTNINIKNSAFLGNTDGTNSPAGIEHDAGGTFSYDNLTFSGNDFDVYSSTATLVTINALNGADPVTERSPTGDVTINNTVSVSVTTIDASTTAAVATARVLLEADTGGGLPSGVVVTITRSGTTASVAHTAHGLSTGDKVAIRGADQGEYNGKKTITVTGVNGYDFTVTGSPTTPATGTITSTAIILDGVTNGSGFLEDTSFNFGGNQPVTGTARRSSTSPLYKAALVVGTITSNGFAGTATMVSDE